MRNLVSIIITNYNYGQYLGAAVASAHNQTYEPIEVVLIDDGSTDASHELIKDLQKHYPKMRVVLQANSGTVKAKRKGIEESSGEYFLHLDADDELQPNAVERLFAELTKHPEAGYAYSQMEMFGAKTGIVPTNKFSATHLVVRGNYISGSSLIRREAYLATPGYVLERGPEDWDLWLSFLEQGFRGAYVPLPLVRYRQHAVTSRNTMTEADYVASERALRQRHPKLMRTYAVPLFCYRVMSRIRRIIGS